MSSLSQDHDLAADAATPKSAATETDGNLLDRLADDGHKWATEFCTRFPAVPFEDALGWFCNAIENTWDVRCSKLTRSAEAWAEFQERINAHRALWDEIDGEATTTPSDAQSVRPDGGEG